MVSKLLKKLKKKFERKLPLYKNLRLRHRTLFIVVLKMNIKTSQEIEVMREGGKKLAQVKDVLRKMVVPGAIPLDIDKKAEKLILELGGTSSFKTVKGYRWTTCINVNDGVVHGIPSKTPFNEGDVVKVDVGIFYKGFHNDSAFTTGAGILSGKNQDMLDAGKQALKESIGVAIVGSKISAISAKMEEVLTSRGYTPVHDLTGHGVGRKLHEEPMIPCYISGNPNNSPVIPEGAALAVEVIYMQGSPELVLAEDGWTIATRDAKIASLFEETIVVTSSGPEVLTA